MSKPGTTRSPVPKRRLFVLAQLYFIVSLVVPMLVPAGMMLSHSSESNIVELSICSATNPRTVFINLETGALVNPDPHLASTSLTVATRETNGHPDSDHDICPFDLATTDHLLKGIFTGNSAPTLVSIPGSYAQIAGYRQAKHPSIPPRGPPLVS